MDIGENSLNGDDLKQFPFLCSVGLKNHWPLALVRLALYQVPLFSTSLILGVRMGAFLPACMFLTEWKSSKKIEVVQ